jgi:peptidoglycan/xylan/chitin deacetylase (PgdA/CDA1 family)
MLGKFLRPFLFVIFFVGADQTAFHFYVAPILMYHHIDHRSDDWKLSVSPENFKRQMDFLKAHQYKVLSLPDYARMIREGESVPRKSVVITFDDGYADNYENAFPVLKDLGFAATIFIQTGSIGKRGYVTRDQVKMLSRHGIEIASHTVNHPFLPDLDEEGWESEMTQSKEALERLLGKPVSSFSYPGGGFNEDIRNMAQAVGYETATTTHLGPLWHRDPMALRRIRISRTADSLWVFWLKVSGFYTWWEWARG